MKFKQVTICSYYDRSLKRRIEKLVAVTTRGNIVERFVDDPEGLFFKVPAKQVGRRKT